MYTDGEADMLAYLIHFLQFSKFGQLLVEGLSINVVHNIFAHIPSNEIKFLMLDSIYDLTELITSL